MAKLKRNRQTTSSVEKMQHFEVIEQHHLLEAASAASSLAMDSMQCGMELEGEIRVTLKRSKGFLCETARVVEVVDVAASSRLE